MARTTRKRGPKGPRLIQIAGNVTALLVGLCVRVVVGIALGFVFLTQNSP